jgi:predicted nucleic acid-binding protein
LILDTNAVSALADGDSDLRSVVSQATQLAVPAVVIGEYLFGLRQSRLKSRYEAWLTQMMSRCDILAIDERTASHYADVRAELRTAGHPIPSNDLWIAALARQYGQPIITRDQHFDFVRGLARIGW